MIKYLERHEYKQNGGNKYHIDCNKVRENKDDIKINSVIRYKNDVSIVSGVLSGIKNDLIPNLKSSRHIVVKIGYENRTLEKEFSVSMKLNEYKIPGYINYICLFSCYDDTYDKIKPEKICNAEEITKNMRKVLIMPYIREGSVRTCKWTKDKFELLKYTIIHIVMSAFLAYHKTGFIHNDFHLDNILLKKTKKQTIDYELPSSKGNRILKIPTYGYKIVIIDFEQSWINVEIGKTQQIYWNNLYNMFYRLNIDLTDELGNLVKIKDFYILTTFIETQVSKSGDYFNTLSLIKLLKRITFEIIQKPSIPEYNPNIY